MINVTWTNFIKFQQKIEFVDENLERLTPDEDFQLFKFVKKWMFEL